jgi:hypothetical protein
VAAADFNYFKQGADWSDKTLSEANGWECHLDQ